MSFLRVIKDKAFLEGTAYIELMPGRYTGECWNQGSLFLDEDTFGFFEGIISNQLPEYDHYAFTEVSSSRWEPIVSRLKGFAAEVRAAREPAELPRDIYYFMNDTEQRFAEEFSENSRRLQEVASELATWLETAANNNDAVTILGL
jgi:hypothetical protein